MPSFTVPSSDYHSAHKPALTHILPAERVERGGSTAFAHDITTGMPSEYDACDVLYADLPWRNGMDEFNHRAGIQGLTYKQFMGAMSDIATNDPRPVVYVTGQHALKSLPKADHVAPLHLNEWAAIAIMYRPSTPTRKWGTATELLLDLANRHDRVGDFCCGYGRTLKIFAKAGNRFTGSDYNTQCIGYIANHIDEWTPNA